MKGLVEVFWEPGKVFDYVRERGAWVVAFLAGLVVFTCMLAYLYETIGAGNITRHALEQSKFAAQLTPERKEAAIAEADTTAGKVRNIGAAVIGYCIAMTVFALLFMGVAAMSGGKLRFGQAMGTVSYSAWPFTLLRFLLSAIVVTIAANKADLDPQRLLAFNPGAFMDKATTARPLYALASALDLFTFAQIGLAAYGLSKTALISFTKTVIGLLLIWLVFTLIAMGLALVF